MTIETLVPKFSIEAFHKRILCRFARLNETQLDAGFSTPKEHRFAGKFGTVVADDLFGLWPSFTELVQKPRYLPAANRY